LKNIKGRRKKLLSFGCLVWLPRAKEAPGQRKRKKKQKQK
jgi:hypothetical protein